MTLSLRAQKGFTLIELMVVVAIIGILSSVAIPEFQRYILRSKATERVMIRSSIERAIEDYHMRNSRFPQDTGGGTSQLNCNWNPPLWPTTSKRPFVQTTVDDWRQLSVAVEGGLYYSYFAWGWQTTTQTYFYTYAIGDLDGDSQYYQGYQFRLLQKDRWADWGSYPTPGSPQENLF